MKEGEAVGYGALAAAGVTHIPPAMANRCGRKRELKGKLNWKNEGKLRSVPLSFFRTVKNAVINLKIKPS